MQETGNLYTLCPENLPTSSPNIGQFAKFLYWHMWTICNKVIINYPTAPLLRRYPMFRTQCIDVMQTRMGF